MFITGDQSVQSTAAKAPPPPPSTEGTVTHTVKSGETVGELSERYGVSEKQILAANPQVRRPVVHFIQFYNQQDTDLGFLPRAAYSWLLAKRVD